MNAGFKLLKYIASHSQGWAGLDDWTKMLDNFKAAVSCEKPASPVSGANNLHIRLLKWLAYLNDKQHGTKIKSNLVAAEIHLSFLCEHQFTAHKAPELSHDLNVLTATQFK